MGGLVLTDFIEARLEVKSLSGSYPQVTCMFLTFQGQGNSPGESILELLAIVHRERYGNSPSLALLDDIHQQYLTRAKLAVKPEGQISMLGDIFFYRVYKLGE